MTNHHHHHHHHHHHYHHLRNHNQSCNYFVILSKAKIFYRGSIGTGVDLSKILGEQTKILWRAKGGNN